MRGRYILTLSILILLSFNMKASITEEEFNILYPDCNTRSEGEIFNYYIVLNSYDSIEEAKRVRYDIKSIGDHQDKLREFFFEASILKITNEGIDCFVLVTSSCPMTNSEAILQVSKFTDIIDSYNNGTDDNWNSYSVSENILKLKLKLYRLKLFDLGLYQAFRL